MLNTALSLRNFLSASLSLTLFESAFRSESINLRLTVSCFLLHFAQTSYFSFFFLFQAFLFQSGSDLASNFFLVVTDDSLLFILLHLSQLLLFSECDFVCNFNFCNKFQIPDAFLFRSLDFSQPLQLNLAVHLFLLLLKLLTLLNTLDLTLLDLINNDKSTLPASILSDNFTLFSHLQRFKPFDLHHQVQLSLFFDPLLLKLFVLFELFVANRDDFRVQNHLVHVFDIVELFVYLGLGFRQDSHVLLSLADLNIVRLNLGSTFFV